MNLTYSPSDEGSRLTLYQVHMWQEKNLLKKEKNSLMFPDPILKKSGLITSPHCSSGTERIKKFAFLWPTSCPLFMFLLSTMFLQALCDVGYLRLNHLAWNSFLLLLEMVHGLDKYLLC